jgi:hypothetical protein
LPIDVRRDRLPETEVLMSLVETLHSRDPAGHFDHTALQICLTHQTGYTVLATVYALFLQGSPYTRAAIGLVALLMDGNDLPEKVSICLHLLTHRPFFPCVVSASGDAVVTAEEPESIVSMMPVNKGEDLRFCSKLN